MNNDIKKRDLDGCYFRVERNGKWTNRCWTDLSEEEQEQFGKDRGPEWWMSLAKHLGDCLRRMGDDLDIVVDSDDE